MVSATELSFDAAADAVDTKRHQTTELSFDAAGCQINNGHEEFHLLRLEETLLMG